MELRLPATEIIFTARFQTSIKGQHSEKLSLNTFFDVQAQKRWKVFCLASRERRGFGPQPTKKDKINKIKAPSEEMGIASQPRKSTSKQSGTIPSRLETTLEAEGILPLIDIFCNHRKVQLNISKVAPGLSSQSDGRSSNIVLDRQFEERLEAVRRSAIGQKKSEEIKQYAAIDYDAPIESEKSTIGFGTKVGVGVAVVVFGLLFALGDFLPSVSVNPTEEAAVVEKKLTEEEKTTLKTRLHEYEAMLGNSPKDPVALESLIKGNIYGATSRVFVQGENAQKVCRLRNAIYGLLQSPQGAAVTLVELGEYGRAASYLVDLAKERPSDPEAYRLLGEVKYELKDYEGSASAYRSSASVSKTINFGVLRGLTNTLLAAKKPNEAVQVLLQARDQLKMGNLNGGDAQVDANDNLATEVEKVDPIQVELLLGKAYSDWGHISDAVSVYDQLISTHPDDFRGYLAKGIILNENGKVGDAERMFIQARFFAPEKAKGLVDRYSRQ